MKPSRPQKKQDALWVVKCLSKSWKCCWAGPLSRKNADVRGRGDRMYTKNRLEISMVSPFFHWKLVWCPLFFVVSSFLPFLKRRNVFFILIIISFTNFIFPTKAIPEDFSKDTLVSKYLEEIMSQTKVIQRVSGDLVYIILGNAPPVFLKSMQEQVEYFYKITRIKIRNSEKVDKANFIIFYGKPSEILKDKLYCNIFECPSESAYDFENKIVKFDKYAFSYLYKFESNSLKYTFCFYNPIVKKSSASYVAKKIIFNALFPFPGHVDSFEASIMHYDIKKVDRHSGLFVFDQLFLFSLYYSDDVYNGQNVKDAAGYIKEIMVNLFK